MKKRGILIIGLIFFVLTIAGLGGYFLIKNQTMEKVYREKMSEGRKYMSQMKYEEAVASFEFALKKNPRNEAAYIAIYRVRAAQGDMDEAIHILKKGYKETRSERLSELLDDYLEKSEKYMAGKDKKVEMETLEAQSEEILMNTSVIQKLKNLNYAGYEKEFGKCISGEMQGKFLEVTHSGIEAIFVYENQRGEEKSIDVAKKVPYDWAKPSSIRVQNLALLFKNFDAGVTLQCLENLVGTKVMCSYNKERETYTDTFTYNDCKIEIACDREGNIIKSSAWNQIVPPKAEERNEKTSVDGVVINALTGQGIKDAVLTFRPKDRELETIEIRTSANGSFETEVEPGQYEIEVNCDGFIADSLQIEAEEDIPLSGISFMLSPVLASGEIRMVLTWGASPADLDSHLKGTSVNGKTFELYYGRRHIENDGQQIASLDVDEISGFGPETTTIYMDGSYHFWIEDYLRTGEIGHSGAEIKVYFSNGQEPMIFRVPEGNGNTWDVFSFENGEIHPINEIR